MTCPLTALSRDVALGATSRFFCAPATLAQTDPQHSIDIAFWIGVLIVLLVIGFGIAIWVKKRYEASGDSPIQVTFTLDDLRRMHRAGQLSDDEFERARARILAQAGYTAPAAPEDAADADAEDAAPGVVETHDAGDASAPGDAAGENTPPRSNAPASTDLSSPQTPPEPALDSTDAEDDLGPELLPDTERGSDEPDPPDREKPDPGGDESRG